MSAAVIQLPGRAALVLPEHRAQAPTPEKLADANRRRMLAELVVMRQQTGISQRKAIEWVLSHLDAQLLPQAVLNAAQVLARSGDAPAPASLRRWSAKLQSGGVLALTANHKGRPLAALGCETRMFALYQKPSQPKAGTVAEWLREEGHQGVTAGKVLRRLKRAPSNFAETSPVRLGPGYYGQNKRHFQVLDWSNLPPGMMYVGDGHRCDVYVEHPATGDPIRPELTLWMDRRSQYIVGAWMAYDENSRECMFGLSEAIYRHRNVPGFIYTDPGPGFTADIMIHPTDGFCARFNIEPIITRPGNPRAKGIIEGFFGRHYEERYGKRWDQAYCGACRTDDDLSRLRDKLKRGTKKLPSWAQYRDGALEFLERYNLNLNKALGCAPEALFATRESSDPILPRELMERPRDRRKVTNGFVRHDNRLYRPLDGHDSALMDRWVMTEWDWRSDEFLWLYEPDTGAYLCQAKLVDRRHGMTQSRIEDAERRREAGRVKRHEQHIEAIRAQSRSPITADTTLDGLESFNGAGALPGPEQKEAEGLPPLDLYNTDY